MPFHFSIDSDVLGSACGNAEGQEYGKPQMLRKNLRHIALSLEALYHGSVGSGKRFCRVVAAK